MTAPWLPLDEGWIPSRIPPPLRASDAWDLARGVNVYAIRLHVSRHEIDRIGAAPAYRLAGEYFALAKALDAGACA